MIENINNQTVMLSLSESQTYIHSFADFTYLANWLVVNAELNLPCVTLLGRLPRHH